MAEEISDPVIITPEKAESEAQDSINISIVNPKVLSDEYSNQAHPVVASSTESVKSHPKIVSRYLKPSVGSCHDFCKYGKRHDESEEKPWKALRRKVRRQNMPNEHGLVQVIVSDEEKNKKNVLAHKKIYLRDLKPSPDTKSLENKVNTSLEKKKVVKKKPSVDVGDLQHSPNTKFFSLKTRSSSDAKLDPSVENVSSGKKTSLSKNSALVAKKSPSPNPSVIIKKELVKSQSVKPKPPSHSSFKSDSIHGKERRNSNAKTVEKVKSSGESVKKFQEPRSATSYSRVPLIKRTSSKGKEGGSAKALSPVKDLLNHTSGVVSHTSNNEKVSEKVLHVIKTEAVEDMSQTSDDGRALSALPSSPSANSLSNEDARCISPHGEEYHEEIEYSEGEDDELISNDDETMELENGETVEENNDKTQQSNGLIVSTNQHSSSEKLKFKSGKVIDLNSDDNTPRKLNFRKARTLKTEDNESDLKWLSFKKAEQNDDDATDVLLSSEKVVLTHQDAQDKKDAPQGLLNDVIEEATSKLVETRKSKVQALVGAFETVITLQETKPSTLAVN